MREGKWSRGEIERERERKKKRERERGREGEMKVGVLVPSPYRHRFCVLSLIVHMIQRLILSTVITTHIHLQEWTHTHTHTTTHTRTENPIHCEVFAWGALAFLYLHVYTCHPS